jgi:hypothetical protein
MAKKTRKPSKPQTPALTGEALAVVSRLQNQSTAAEPVARHQLVEFFKNHVCVEPQDAARFPEYRRLVNGWLTAVDGKAYAGALRQGMPQHVATKIGRSAADRAFNDFWGLN